MKVNHEKLFGRIKVISCSFHFYPVDTPGLSIRWSSCGYISFVFNLICINFMDIMRFENRETTIACDLTHFSSESNYRFTQGMRELAPLLCLLQN